MGFPPDRVGMIDNGSDAGTASQIRLLGSSYLCPWYAYAVICLPV